jgi:F420-non-reducing hydrogenase large subunit
MRKRLRAIVTNTGGKIIHPVFGVPGGVSKGIKEEEREEIIEVARDAVEFAKFLLAVLDDVVLKNKGYVDLVVGDVYKHATYYMGLVDDEDHVNFYDGKIRVVSPDGKEVAKFEARDYVDHIAERVEPWSYVKFPYLKSIGWNGFTDGPDSGVYRVAPLARLNASSGMATPLAQAEHERMFETLGGKPAHGTLAFHWARLVEALYAAERMLQLAEDPVLCDPNIRNIPKATPSLGVGVVEAPRGTLLHHYETDKKGILTRANLIVATQNNAAAICMSVKRAASELIKGGNVSDGILNMVEMAFRAYDPCFACATHTLPGQMPLEVNIYDKDRNLLRKIRRD